MPTSLRRPVALVEAVIAQRTVKLAPEPPGDRAGVVRADGLPKSAEQAQNPLTLVALGDSLVAGSGVANQDEALVPRIARILAVHTRRDIAWSTHAKLGSTMRRVRYRFLPQVESADLLFICAGSNDLMARRSPQEWEQDLTAVLDGALERSPHVVVCSAGQLYRSPALLPTLRGVLRETTDAQTDASAAICATRGVPYVDVAHCDLIEDFWAQDNFHPGPLGYELAADKVAEVMLNEFAEDLSPHQTAKS